MQRGCKCDIHYLYDIIRQRAWDNGSQKYIAAVLALVLLTFCGCSRRQAADPYEGMVQVPSGYGADMWVTLHEDVPVSAFKAEDFESGEYLGADYVCTEGIDVSEHQGLIDWEAVAADGIDFAVIRGGYRGYSEGGLFVDRYFHENIRGALENGIDVGVYFFSQATNVAEATEEAGFAGRAERLRLRGSDHAHILRLGDHRH